MNECDRRACYIFINGAEEMGYAGFPTVKELKEGVRAMENKLLNELPSL